MADPLWRDLLKYSNEGKYGEFVKKFAKSLALAMNQVGRPPVRQQRAGQEPVRRCRLSRHHPPRRACDGSLPATEHQEAGRMARQAGPRLRRWRGQDFRGVHLLSASDST